MDPITIFGLLTSVAPSLMKMFGASEPSVAVAEKAISIAQTVTGTSNPQDALAKLKADAELRANFDIKVLEQQGDLIKAHLADRADARARDNTFRAASQRNYRGDWLAGLAIIAFMISLGIVLFIKIPDGVNRDIIFTMVGALIMIVKDVYGFEFGSSKQSQAKDAVIQNLTKDS